MRINSELTHLGVSVVAAAGEISSPEFVKLHSSLIGLRGCKVPITDGVRVLSLSEAIRDRDREWLAG